METLALKPLEPVDTRPLFMPLHRELIALLKDLDDGDWGRATVAGEWRVRDIAAHLLDVQVRDVAILRDGYVAPPDGPINSYDDLLAFLDRLNADWVHAMQRLSPRLLVDLLGTVGEMAATALKGQSMDAEATFAVDWAGVDQSRQWMHVGRQYTEYWHHQMQIRDAVGVSRLLDSYWLRPLLDLSLRALVRTYQGVDAPVGTTVTLRVRGDLDERIHGKDGVVGAWTLHRYEGGWTLQSGAPEHSTTIVRLEADESWRLLYNARSAEAAREKAKILGESRWAEPLWRTRSAMVREPNA